jgi:DNA-binding LacI/PurR family transcriptional regulator
MADSAEVAGISHERVSPALDGFPHFRPEMRDRVLAAIEEIGYRRRTAAGRW